MIIFVKKYYKLFIYSFIVWFCIIIFFELAENIYQIRNNYISKLSQDFILTTALGVITTIAGALFNYQRKKIVDNKEAIENHISMATDSIHRLEDMIDQQTFELRRLDEYSLTLAEFRSSQSLLKKEYQNISIELERQKEQIKQSDRFLLIFDILVEDSKERKKLRDRLEKVLKTKLSDD
jgi:hypothetical protein